MTYSLTDDNELTLNSSNKEIILRKLFKCYSIEVNLNVSNGFKNILNKEFPTSR